MAKIADYKCNHTDYKGFNRKYVESLGLSMPEIFTDADSIAAYAKAQQDKNGNRIIKLPFDFYLQGEAIGADILCDDTPLGVKKASDRFKDIKGIAELPPIDMSLPRLTETFKACDMLRAEGRKVAIHLRGLVDTMNSFMDAQDIVMGMMMQKDDMLAVAEKLKKDIVTYALEAQKHCDILFYEDATGGVNILGPRVVSKIVDMFTYPIMKELDEVLDPGMGILLCPKVTLMLTGTEKAKQIRREDIKGECYADICLSLPEEIRIVGQMCNRMLDIEYKGEFSYLELM